MQTILVSKRPASTICVGHNIVNAALEAQLREGEACRYAIISDDCVAEHHAQQVINCFLRHGIPVKLFTFHRGEQQKTRSTKMQLEDALLAEGYLRDTVLVALGGGVVSDITGFIAATFCRGIDWISIPTTLMAMVDASVGGKTGVNTDYGKNMIGCFHPASQIISDTQFLQTLPRLQLIYGMAEMLKHACISCLSHLKVMENNTQLWLEQPNTMASVIAQQCRIKMRFVHADPKDCALRMALNFGHTAGHALEQISDYQVAHGMAVYFGLLLESYCAYHRAKMTDNEIARLLSYVQQFDLDWSAVLNDMTAVQLIEAMGSDKKRQSAGAIPFVQLKSLGCVSKEKLIDSYSADEIMAAYQAVCRALLHNPLL